MQSGTSALTNWQEGALLVPLACTHCSASLCWKIPLVTETQLPGHHHQSQLHLLFQKVPAAHVKVTQQAFPNLKIDETCHSLTRYDCLSPFNLSPNGCHSSFESGNCSKQQSCEPYEAHERFSKLSCKYFDCVYMQCMSAYFWHSAYYTACMHTSNSSPVKCLNDFARDMLGC